MGRQHVYLLELGDEALLLLAGEGRDEVGLLDDHTCEYVPATTKRRTTKRRTTARRRDRESGRRRMRCPRATRHARWLGPRARAA